MAQWHRSRRADIGLRLAGLILCGIAYVAFARLFRDYGPTARAPTDFVALGLAMIGFLSASAGLACVCLGHHLFDEIEVSARWRRDSGEVTPLHDVIRNVRR